jgi:hypothetical protein
MLDGAQVAMSSNKIAGKRSCKFISGIHPPRKQSSDVYYVFETRRCRVSTPAFTPSAKAIPTASARAS